MEAGFHLVLVCWDDLANGVLVFDQEFSGATIAKVGVHIRIKLIHVHTHTSFWSLIFTGTQQVMPLFEGFAEELCKLLAKSGFCGLHILII
jgi:hypothetical protein